MGRNNINIGIIGTGQIGRRHLKNYVSPQQHWICALQDEVELLPTAEIALNTMLISEGIYLSSELGREVSAEEVREISRSKAVQPSLPV